MFQFIEPEEHFLYQSQILPFMEALADNPKLYDFFENWEEGVFLLTKNKTKQVQGGALLLKQSVEMLHPLIREHLKRFYPKMEDVWTGVVSLQIPEDLRGQDYQKFCRFFYYALLADLIAFGIKENASFLCLTLEPVEYLSINLQAIWPYALEVNPQFSKDGLFHGILTLINVNQRAALPKYLKKQITVH